MGHFGPDFGNHNSKMERFFDIAFRKFWNVLKDL